MKFGSVASVNDGLWEFDVDFVFDLSWSRNQSRETLISPDGRASSTIGLVPRTLRYVSVMTVSFINL